MHPLKNIRQLLQPSLSSFVVSVLLTIVIVAGGLWFSDIKSGVLFNSLIFGASSSTNTLTASQTTLTQLNDRIFGNPTFNKILFYGAWLFVGCLVYMVVSAIAAVGSESAATSAQMKYINAGSAQLKRAFLSRLGVRLAVIVLGVIYTIFFIRLLLPYALYAASVGANQAGFGSAVAYLGLSAAILLVSWHIFVVLLRLIALKTRLFESN